MTTVKTVETPDWDALPDIVKNNLQRQHREGGISLFNLPEAEWYKEIALETHAKAKKDARDKIAKLQDELLAARSNKLNGIRNRIKDALAELDDANEAYKTARDECEHTETVRTLKKGLKASTWIRMAQVSSILGDLHAEDIGDDVKADIAAHAVATAKSQKKLRLKMWL